MTFVSLWYSLHSQQSFKIKCILFEREGGVDQFGLSVPPQVGFVCCFVLSFHYYSICRLTWQKFYEIPALPFSFVLFSNDSLQSVKKKKPMCYPSFLWHFVTNLYYKIPEITLHLLALLIARQLNKNKTKNKTKTTTNIEWKYGIWLYICSVSLTVNNKHLAHDWIMSITVNTLCMMDFFSFSVQFCF